MSRLKRLISSFKNRGLKNTLKAVWVRIEDPLFDMKYGTDTASYFDISKLTDSEELISHSYGYQPTRVRAVLKLLSNLKFSHQFGFVDLGCGKGRVLMLAAKYGFRSIKGVEFSSTLCEIARNNIDMYARYCPAAKNIDLINSDVRNYEFRSNDNVVFMFNPFDEQIMEDVLLKLRYSAEQYPRPIFIIYNNPIHGTPLNSESFLMFRREQELFTSRFAIFSNMEILLD